MAILLVTSLSVVRWNVTSRTIKPEMVASLSSSKKDFMLKTVFVVSDRKCKTKMTKYMQTIQSGYMNISTTATKWSHQTIILLLQLVSMSQLTVPELPIPPSVPLSHYVAQVEKASKTGSC